jgi:hypothetical protein
LLIIVHRLFVCQYIAYPFTNTLLTRLSIYRLSVYQYFDYSFAYISLWEKAYPGYNDDKLRENGIGGALLA